MTNRQYKRCKVTAHVEEIRSASRLARMGLPPRCVGAPLGCRGALSALRTRQMVADPVAELQQLALDPLVSPAVVLGGEPLDQRGDLSGSPAAVRLVRVGPLPATRRRCQRRTVPGVTSRSSAASRAGAGSARRGPGGRPSRAGAGDWCGAVWRPRAAARDSASL